MAPLILFDIDHTLFDTDSYKNFYPEYLSLNLGVPKELIYSVRDTYHKTLKKHTDYHFRDFLSNLSATTGISSQKISSVYYTPKVFSFLFPDDLSSLKKLSKTFHLGIFSEGFTHFQTTKLELSGILNYFDPKLIFIHRRKLSPRALTLIPKDSYIVDDDSEIISLLVKNPKFKPIWLNRKNTSKHPIAPTIHSLTEIFPLLK